MVWRRPIGHAGGNGGHLAPTGIDRRQPQRSFELMTAVFLLVLIAACNGTAPAPTPEQRLIVKGREIFFQETFN